LSSLLLFPPFPRILCGLVLMPGCALIIAHAIPSACPLLRTAASCLTPLSVLLWPPPLFCRFAAAGGTCALSYETWKPPIARCMPLPLLLLSLQLVLPCEKVVEVAWLQKPSKHLQHNMAPITSFPLTPESDIAERLCIVLSSVLSPTQTQADDQHHPKICEAECRNSQA
jgi:hypothetical protein